MRYLILSDMHGNWDAFQVVLDHALQATYDRVLVLGDLVGYGASPNEIVEAVQKLPNLVVVRGNHDKVVAGIDRGENFNHVALAAARWSTAQLTPENLAYVKALPVGPHEIEPGIAICHGSPLDEDAYVFTDYDAYEIFAGFSANLVFFGHTHVPSLFSVGRRGVEVKALRNTGTMTLDPKARYLLNPGSIGQPRDRDPRASYMVFDQSELRISWFRLDYPLNEAQRRIVDAGLPQVLSDRLAVGV